MGRLRVPVGQDVNVVEVGPAGLVITDVWVHFSGTVDVNLYEGPNKMHGMYFSSSARPSHHAMTTGIPFAPGTTLRVDHN